MEEDQWSRSSSHEGRRRPRSTKGDMDSGMDAAKGEPVIRSIVVTV